MNGLQDGSATPSPAHYNQQVYQRLKLSLSLDLRRQLFVAVCDDPNLRNRLAGQLHRELVQQGADQVAASIERSGIPTIHENLVSLKLDLNDPNPIAQISHWLRTNVPRSEQDQPMPSFQILGIEQLTRQPAAVQRLFLSYLRALERQLPALNSALILWVTRPWYHNIRKSAPECWQWCSGTFEFMAEPLPLSADERPQTSVPEMDALTPGADSGVPLAKPMGTALAQPAEPPTSQNSNDAEEAEIGEYSAAKVIAAEAALMAASGVDARITEDDDVAQPPDVQAPKPQDIATDSSERSDSPISDTTAQTDETNAHLTVTPAAPTEQDNPTVVAFDRIYGPSEASEVATSEVEASQDANAIAPEAKGSAAAEASTAVVKEPQLPKLEPTSKPAEKLSQAPIADSYLTASQLTQDPKVSQTQQETVQQPTDASPSPFAAPKPAEGTASTAVNPEKPATTTVSHTFASAAEREEAQLLAHIEVLRQQNASSEDLAISYLELGRFYRRRMEQGDQSQDFTRYAIVAYEQVLEWLCFNDPAATTSSLSWPDTLNDLGTLYWMASRKPESPEMGISYIKLAIQTYRLGLKNTNPEDNPKAFAMLQNNLGTVHSDFAHHQDSAENLTQAIDAYKEALRFRQPESAPLKYASTQNNLGTAYWHLAQHANAPENLKWAIAAYSQAAQYYNPDEQPDSYAMIQNNLGTAYWNLAQIAPNEESPEGNGHFMAQEWLLLAVNAYNNALRFRTLQVAPGSYASTQNNLGTAYWQLANQEGQQASAGKEYLQLSIRAYEAALKAADFLQGQNMLAQLNFDPFATHSNTGLVHYQLATDFAADFADEAQQQHLDKALTHHVQAMTGWKEKPELYDPAMAVLVQTIQRCYEKWGSSGQNRALGLVPGELLPELLPKL